VNPPSFVVFSDDWGAHPSSAQHLFRQICRTHQALWVNTIGMRRPTFSVADLRKVRDKVGRMLGASPKPRHHAVIATNPAVCQPLMFPYSNIRAIRAFNARSVIRTVEAEIGRAGLSQPIVVTTVPNACDYAESAAGRRVVYYCVDDFSQWPGLDSRLVRSMEDRLVRRADVIVATSENLRARLALSGKPTHLLTHGVDAVHFTQSDVPEHAVLAAIARPRVGYFGLIDDRMDRNLVAAVARAMPEVAFVFAGPVEADLSQLRAIPNVTFTGRLPYAELPSFIAGLDVLLLPYKADEFGDTLAPLKLKEYLITGKPVISTPIAEAKRMADHLFLAATAQDWIATLQEFRKSSGRVRGDMSQVLGAETWEAKAAQFISMCTAGSESQHA
jgi:glycosyltransferase involved in cell wall biosynthesis